MSLLSVVIILLVVGVLLWAVNKYIPLDETMRKVINVVIILGVIVWLLKIFGFWGMASGIRI